MPSSILLGNLVTLAENPSVLDKACVVRIIGHNQRSYKTTVMTNYTFVVRLHNLHNN